MKKTIENNDLIIYKIYDTIVCVKGSYNFKIYETVKFEDGNMGYVISVGAKTASIAMLEGDARIGDAVYPTGETFHTFILSKPFGKMFDASGQLIEDLMAFKEGSFEDKNLLRTEKKMYLFEEPKTIYTRERVETPVVTGTFALDTMIPIGRGQRELIVGDSKTGKTSIAINMLIAQKDSDINNIYVAIGKKKSEIIDIINTLKEYDVLHKTILIVASAEDYSGKKVIAPYTGMAFARFLCEQAQDTLIVLDDLTIHADAYREQTLLVGQAPGREAFPGDIFYMHSRLLENAGNYNHFLGGGSITAIPIVETQSGDISGYIPTNVISITDGQIYTSKSLFNKKIIPAIDIPVSVSRIGSAAQTTAMEAVSSGLKLSYINYNEQMKMSSFGSELNSKFGVDIVKRGQILHELTKQDEYVVINYGVSAIMSSLAKSGYFDFYSDDIDIFEKIKEVLLSFLTYDVLGQKVAQVFSFTSKQTKKNDFEINIDLINKYLIHIILPLLKYHISQNVPGINKNRSFIEKYGDIRVDSRILLSHERKKYDIGIAYDYQI